MEKSWHKLDGGAAAASNLTVSSLSLSLSLLSLSHFIARFLLRFLLFSDFVDSLFAPPMLTHPPSYRQLHASCTKRDVSTLPEHANPLSPTRAQKARVYTSLPLLFFHFFSGFNSDYHVETMYLKRQEGQLSEGAAMRLCLGRQLLLPSSPDSTLDATAHIRVGSYYEIDHSKLPTNAPDQLKLVRVIMVNKKSKSSVSLRYPSVYSLHAHFSERNYRKLAKMLPSLDEHCAMGSELAGDVLYRRIPPHEIAVQRNQWNFWIVVSSKEQERGKNPSLSPATVTRYVNAVSTKGLCLSELKSTGMVQWGRRKQVRFLGPQVEERRERSLPRTVNGEEEEKGNEDDEEDDEGDEKEIMVSDEENKETDRKSCKRKVHGASYKTQMPKKLKHETQNQQITRYKPSKRREVKNSIERWSFQRYNLAAENMLKIMKEKGAVFRKPILRPALRVEARKLIGDTGLLDHLLKHMAGKVAPGGEERFMRRHNADGAMEYWLESADLMDIRKEAGVQDPYWTPPPGWKLGDNPVQNPVCARELKELREEIAKLKEY
ncbi:protein DYAD-like [Durio zibethinus]|uniref:Protein DYAD-like n=1 Tax=Durio zibethinus TaxID=66656 RepID=A0A6P5ZUL2_DURZI|nr:protein DYAD-like [Durio zibethinus]